VDTETSSLVTPCSSSKSVSVMNCGRCRPKARHSRRSASGLRHEKGRAGRRRRVARRRWPKQRTQLVDVISQKLLVMLFCFVDRIYRSWPLVEVNLVSFLHPKIARPEFHGLFLARDGDRVRYAITGPCLGYCAIKPPSITSSVPVMNEASSEARNN